MAEADSARPHGISARAGIYGAAGQWLLTSLEFLATDPLRRPVSITSLVAAILLAVTALAVDQPLATILLATALIIGAYMLGTLQTRPAVSSLVSPLASGDVAQAEAASRPSNGPAPLPFMGERLVIEPSSAGIERLIDAATRARRFTVVEARGWGDLMARVSHELRTPLNAVIGFSDVMDAELFGPVGHPRYREYARHIRDCGRELLKSAEDTLAITSLLEGLSGTASQVELASVAGDAWRFFADEATVRGIALHLDVPEGLELVGELRPMRQILVNLFAEAILRAEDQGVVALTASADGDLVQLEVRGGAAGRADGAMPASLPICLARALLELQGATLLEIDEPSAAWRAVTVLSCAAQPDFFLSNTAHEASSRLC